MNKLQVSWAPPLAVEYGGLFVSRGRGVRHAERVLTSNVLIFVHQGTLGMFEEGHEFTVSAGQTLLLEAGRRHGGTLPYPDDLRFYWIHFTVSPSVARDANVSIDVPRIATLPDPNRLTSLFRRYLDDQEDGRRHEPMAGLIMAQMLCEVASAGARGPRMADAASVIAQRADEYIRTHALESIRASRVASALDYHPDYLGRLYRRTYGIPMTEAVNRRRIREAKRDLLESPLTIEQIAVRCGFADAEYFRRVFRKLEGMTPSGYRRLYARFHVNSE